MESASEERYGSSDIAFLGKVFLRRTRRPLARTFDECIVKQRFP